MTRRASIDPPSRRIAAVPNAVRPIVEAARRVVIAAAPGADEVACGGERPRSPSMMWKLVRYLHDGDVVVTLGAFTHHASMFFAHGAELEDPENVLEGSGKLLRYVTLRAPADAERPAVRAVVRRAFALAKRGRSAGRRSVK